jgi:ubiquinone/menaquinone biosynthesis C-methylase UbiE
MRPEKGKIIVEYEDENWPLGKYYFALNYVTPESTVLDAACGVGFGSFILSQKAKKVFGVDIDEPSLAQARSGFAAENIGFLKGDVRKLDFPDEYFDLFVSIETIEHLNEKDQALYLREAGRVLKKNGTLIVSTPDKDVEAAQGMKYGHFHEKEFTKDELAEFIGRYFGDVQIFGQGRFSPPSFLRKILNLLKKIDLLKIRKLPFLKRTTKKIDRATSPIKFEYGVFYIGDSPARSSHIVMVCKNPLL